MGKTAMIILQNRVMLAAVAADAVCCAADRDWERC